MTEKDFDFTDLKGIGELNFDDIENEESTNNIIQEEPETEDEELIIDDLDELDEGPSNIDMFNDEEITGLQDTITNLKSELNINRDKFSRTENKFDFASEVINALENQKTANLVGEEIDDLIKKRKFTNICKQFDWNVMANIMNSVVTDIESYSLSKDALLVKLITTDLSRNISISEQNIKKVKGGRKSKDEIIV